MKTLKLIAITSIIMLLCISCEKDENGNRITYYKNKTGEGYVFYKFENDSIAPIESVKIGIESYIVEMFSTITRHFDYVNIDNNGKYSFNFVKNINGKKTNGYCILSPSPIGYDEPIPSSGNVHFDHNSLEESNTIFIDTIFIYIDRR